MQARAAAHYACVTGQTTKIRTNGGQSRSRDDLGRETDLVQRAEHGFRIGGAADLDPMGGKIDRDLRHAGKAGQRSFDRGLAMAAGHVWYGKHGQRALPWI